MIDLVCLVHGLKMSEHQCVYCCLCFTSLKIEECSIDEESGKPQDVCIPCQEKERKFMCNKV